MLLGGLDQPSKGDDLGMPVGIDHQLVLKFLRKVLNSELRDAQSSRRRLVGGGRRFGRCVDLRLELITPPDRRFDFRIEPAKFGFPLLERPLIAIDTAEFVRMLLSKFGDLDLGLTQFRFVVHDLLVDEVTCFLDVLLRVTEILLDEESAGWNRRRAASGAGFDGHS